MSTAIQIQTTYKLSDIDHDLWDRVDQVTPYASYRWHRFSEIVCAEDVPVYILALHQGEPIARAVFWLIRREPLPISNPIVRHGLQAMFRRWPLMICHTPLVSISGLRLPEWPLRDVALTLIAREAIAVGRHHGMFAAVFDYLLGDRLANLTWPDGFITMEMSESGTYLEVNWPDFDGYVNALGQSARKDFNRHRNRATDAGIKIQTLSQVSDIEGALTLIRNVDAHHRSSSNPYTQRILENIELGDGIWLEATIEGRLVGCGALFADRGVSTLALLGLDYTEKYVYFQLMYAAIRHAIESGATLLRGGSGAYEFKRRLGFQQESHSSIAFFINNRLLRQIANWL